MIIGKDFRMDSDVCLKHKAKLKFGNHVAIDKGVYCTTQMDIGDYVHIAPYCVIIGGVDSEIIMEHFSGLATGAKIVCGGDDFSTGALMNPQVPPQYRDIIIHPVVFRMFSCIGVNSCVMPGVTLAEGSVVGAHSLLTKSTEPWTIYAGSPARPIKKRSKTRAYKYAKELGYDVF
jgi:acetyltransferase-like isoleucine patch superfamily enzyme